VKIVCPQTSDRRIDRRTRAARIATKRTEEFRGRKEFRGRRKETSLPLSLSLSLSLSLALSLLFFSLQIFAITFNCFNAAFFSGGCCCFRRSDHKQGRCRFMFPGNKAQKRRYGTPLQMSSLFAGSPGQTGSHSVFAPKRDYRNNANRFSLPTSRSRDVNGVTEIKEREREREGGERRER